MSAGAKVVKSLVSSPLPLMIEKLGLSVAQAQAALDKNSIEVAKEMAGTEIDINGSKYNLLSLGFAPTFYAFTEATVEAKMQFSMKESTEFSIGAKVEASVGFVGISVEASYARKFEMSAEGSSSIAARLLSVPAPERFTEILKEIGNDDGGTPSLPE